MNPLVLLNWRVWAAVAIGIALAASHWKVYTMGKQNVQTQWDAEKADAAKQTIKLLEQRDATSAALQADKDKLRKTKDAQINSLNADLADALERLRSRPERPSEGDLPNDPRDGSSSQGCTGAGLYLRDAQFLTRLAGDARRLQIELKSCYEQYDKVRDAINGAR